MRVLPNFEGFEFIVRIRYGKVLSRGYFGWQKGKEFSKAIFQNRGHLMTSGFYCTQACCVGIAFPNHHSSLSKRSLSSFNTPLSYLNQPHEMSDTAGPSGNGTSEPERARIPENLGSKFGDG